MLAQFVIEVDEGLFTAFVPKQLKTLLGELEDLPGLPSMSYKGLDASAVLKLAGALLVMFAVAIPLLIVPQGRILQDAGEAFCGAHLHCMASAYPVHACNSTGDCSPEFMLECISNYMSNCMPNTHHFWLCVKDEGPA